jgi:anti-sigma regulatory factor (Ser/Thr protein kinase)
VAEPESSGLWHAALFHRDTAEFETQACLFAEDAARAGAAVLMVGPASSMDRLRGHLNGLGERVTWVDVSETGANPGRLISAISQFSYEHPGRDTWCVQQVAWPSRPAEEMWEVLRHEALLNMALAGAPVRMLCPYDTRLSRDLISCAEATHPVISPHGRFQPSPRYRDDVPGLVPAECDRPLSSPPSDARVLAYADDLSTIRHLVSLQARVAGLSPSRTGDLLISVGELAANTLAHADGPGTLTMWTTGMEIICQVSDPGHITDPLAGRLRPGPAAGRGGRGLWLVHQLCDLVQVRTGQGGTTVRVHMRLPVSGEAGRRPRLPARRAPRPATG